MANHCVWLSIDPVRRKVDFYPKPIAKQNQQYANSKHNVEVS